MRRTLRRVLQLFYELLTFFPLLPVLAIASGTEDRIWLHAAALLWPGALGMLVAMLAPIRWWVRVSFLAIPLGCFSVVAAFLGEPWSVAAFLCVPALLLYVWMLRITPRDPLEVNGIKHTITGFSLYAGAYAVLYLFNHHVFLPALSWLFLAFALVTMFVVNTASVLTATDGKDARQGVPANLRTGNRIATALLAALLVLVVFFDRLRIWVGRLLVWIKDTVWAMLDAGLARIWGAPGAEISPSAGDMVNEFAQETVDRPMTAFEETITYVLVGIAVVAFAILLLYILYRIGRFLYRWLQDVFRNFFAPEDAGYTDERESLVDWKASRRELMENAKKRFGRLMAREPQWGDLDARGRVRLAYQKWLRRAALSGLEVRSRTAEQFALDTGNEPAGDLDRAAFVESYNRARYSEHEISPEQAENARRAFQK